MSFIVGLLCEVNDYPVIDWLSKACHVNEQFWLLVKFKLTSCSEQINVVSWLVSNGSGWTVTDILVVSPLQFWSDSAMIL